MQGRFKVNVGQTRHYCTTTPQLMNTMDKVEEELQAIIFMYKTDKSRYDRIIKEKENDVLECKDTFLKMVADACWVLGG